MDLINDLSDGIKREAEAHKLTIGDQESKISEIPESIIPSESPHQHTAAPRLPLRKGSRK